MNDVEHFNLKVGNFQSPETICQGKSRKVRFAFFYGFQVTFLQFKSLLAILFLPTKNLSAGFMSIKTAFEIVGASLKKRLLKVMQVSRRNASLKLQPTTRAWRRTGI